MWCWSINRQNRKYSSVVRLRKSFKALCKATLHPKKVKVNVWWSAMGLIHYSFLNPSKTITSEKHAQQKASKTARPAAGIGQQKGPSSSPWQYLTACHTTNASKVDWTNWATKFCLICHIHLTSRQLTTTFSIISTTFCRQNASTTSKR